MATALSEDRLRGGGGGGDASDMACIMRICQPMREQDPIILISLWPDSVYYNYIILPLSYFISYFLLYLPASGPDPVKLGHFSPLFFTVSRVPIPRRIFSQCAASSRIQLKF